MTTKIATRKASMRHTATLEVELSYARDRATAGVVLAESIEGLLDWRHMGVEWLCSRMAELLEIRQEHLKEASNKRNCFGAGVDASKFADE